MKLRSSEHTVEKAASILFSNLIKAGYKIVKMYSYDNLSGGIDYWRARLENPNNDSKKIMPISIDSEGYYHTKEPDYLEGKKILYNLPDIANNTDVVFITEGEKCTDLLKNCGLIVTTSGGSTSAAGADWSILSGRTVTIWPDADPNGEKYAHAVTDKLLNLRCKVSIIDIKTLNLEKGEDCEQWLERNPNATRNDILDLPVISCELEAEEPDESWGKVGLLLLLTKDVEFFHDKQNVAHATINHHDHVETMRLDDEQFCNWLSRLYWSKYGEGLSKQALQSAISTMKGKALYEDRCHPVYMRVGALGGAIYIYLANEHAQVVKISQAGWEILDVSPVKFVKTKNMRSLPLPIPGGDINLIWKYANIPENARYLVIAWLLECLRLDTVYPIMMLHGLYGSAKSSTQQVLCDLIDPSIVSLRGAPRNIDDILIATANNYVVSFNNLSSLKRHDQDDLCCVATGGGIGKRSLYTNLDESLVNMKRPLIMNGINNPITASDLISRSIIIELPAIETTKYKSEMQLREDFINDYPSIVGGLYDLYVAVLNTIPDVELKEMPRLADFAILGTALERVLNLEHGAFMKSFDSNMQGSMLNTLYSHPIMVALIKFIKVEKPFRGTFTELLDKLNDSKYKPRYVEGWPATGQALANEMKIFASALEGIGINVIFVLQRSNRGKIVEITVRHEVLEY